MKTANPTQLSEGADLEFSTVIIRQNAVDSVKPLFYGSASKD
jgi:hypothetical protein